MAIRRFTITFNFLLFFILSSHLIHAQTYLENFLDVRSFVTIGETSYFTARTLQNKWGLWKTNGTQKGTELVHELYNSSYDPGELFVYNNELYFAGSDESSDVELWKSDGTSTGTYLLKNLNTGQSASSRPSEFTIVNGILYFTASNQYLNGAKKLHRTDGTTEGTFLADHIIADDSSSDVSNLTSANGKLYFTRGSILYESDGTTEGTKSIVIDGLPYSGNYHSFGPDLYFITYNYNKTYIRLYRLTDADNYVMLKEFSTENHNGYELYGLSEVDGKIVFAVVSGETYNNVKDELWVTDGTPEGTVELMTQGGDNSLWFEPHFSGFTVHDGIIYFNAGPATDNSLWKTDGTAQGTVQVGPVMGLSGDAPLVSLGTKLYFLGGLYLYSYDTSTQEYAPFWQLKSYRKSTGDTYFIKSDGRFVYAAVKNERQKDANNMDLFHTGDSPLMKIVTPYSILHNETIKFNTKKDSLIVKQINVQNVGHAPLNFSRVFVSGEGFYVNSRVDVNWYQQENQTYFPQRIAPSERGLFEIGFLPQSPGVYSGYLILRSNDTSQPEFRIKLEGNVSETEAGSLNGTFPTEKEIAWTNTNASIFLDNLSISENAVPGNLVGSFSTNASDGVYTYQFVDGAGSEDNSNFTISDNQLLTADKFQEDHINSYSIRVKSVAGNGNEVAESFVIGVHEESIEVELEACEKVVVPLTSDLYSVDFINETDAIAVGAQGVILKTSDKGSTWQVIHKIERSTLIGGGVPFTSSLYHVEFIDENTGFINGVNVLLRTDDAGNSWKPLTFHNLSSYEVANLKAISPQVLFLAVNNYFSSNYLYVSKDGGNTWSQTSPTGIRDILNIYFYDDTLGFMSDTSEGYYKTNDGGNSWTYFELEVSGLSYEDITGFSFLNQNVGYASTKSGKVLKTGDGGLSWSLVNSEYRSSISKIHFIDENIGYIVAGSIFETSDGGLNWIRIETSVCAEFRDIAFNVLGDKIAVGVGCYVGNGRTIYRELANENWFEVSAIYGSRKIHQIIFDGTEAYLFTESQSKKSSDGGVTWKEMITPVDGEIAAAQKMGSALLLKSHSRKFYKSIDGGLTWNELNGGAEYLGFDTIGEAIIIAATFEGGMAKSTDAGDTWTVLSGASSNYKNPIEFFDEDFGFAVSNGKLERTQDGGVTWSWLTVDSSEEYIFFYDIEFVTSQTAIISTDNGYYKTDNSGETWTKLPLQDISSAKIFIVSELEWYFATKASIYSTRDGGISWERYFKSDNGDIVDVEYDGGMFYYANDNAGVYRIEDDKKPLDAGYIYGDLKVRVGDEEIYTVLKHSDNKYSWEVEGSHPLISEDAFARVKWDSPGTYILKVTPYASCESGNATEVVVSVYDVPASPEISGPIEVLENSTGKVYSTPLEDQTSYLWSVTGHRDFLVEGNTLTVDWGGIGQGEVGLIRTDLLTEMRSYTQIDVAIVPQDPFSILQTDAICRETANGSVHISSRLPEVVYRATLTGNEFNQNIDFSAETIFDGLLPGSYDLCLEEPGIGRNFCYRITISEPPPFEVSSKIASKSTKEVNLTLKGGLPPYTILLNGNIVAETSQKDLRLSAENGDLLEVISAGGCAFSHTEVIYFPGWVAISPNPVVNSFSVILGHDFPEEKRNVSVRIFDMAGHQVQTTMGNISNNTFHGDLSELPSGFYIVQLGDKKNTSFKVIKK